MGRVVLLNGALTKRYVDGFFFFFGYGAAVVFFLVFLFYYILF
jgi:hypothetical protein